MLVVSVVLAVFIVVSVVNGGGPVVMGLLRVVAVMLVFVVRVVLTNASVATGRVSRVVSYLVRACAIRNNARVGRVVLIVVCVVTGKARRVTARMEWAVVSVMFPIVVLAVRVVPTNVLAVVGRE